MDGYSALGSVYDTFTENVDYDAAARYCDAVFNKNSINKIVLDAGCGTGTLTLLLSSLGYDMIGVDVSEQMLARAYEKAAETGADVRFICQDLCELDLYGTVGGVVCMLDTLSHIPSKKQLETVLSRFSLFTEKGGILIFDLNTEYKHRNSLADNTFVFEDENSFVVWRNSLDEKSARVDMTVNVFSAVKSGYRRDTDEFSEYVYDLQTVKALLERCGYELCEVLDGESYKQLDERSERMLICAKKVK